MKISIETTLVISERIRMRNDNVISIAVEGPRIYPIGEMIPVILRGEGCIGLALIKEFHVTEQKTTVGFIMHDCDDTTAEVLYNQYRDKISSGSYEDDSFEAVDDVVIPGMARRSNSSKPKTSGRPKPSQNYHW